MNNNSKRDLTYFHADTWHATQSDLYSLELGKYGDFTKPVFCPFLNHWINFWIVLRVFRAQLGLIFVRQIQVWLYLIDEQCFKSFSTNKLLVVLIVCEF